MPETTSSPFTLTLADGSVVKAESVEEAVRTLAKMKEDTSAELHRTREQLKAVQEQQDAARAEQERQAAAARAAQAQANGEFSNDKYYELLASNPLAANDYYFKHRFGAEPTEVVSDFQRMRGTVTNMEQQTVAAAFLAAHQDFPGDAESTKAMRKRTEELTAQGAPFNPETLERAYYQLVNEGVVKPAKVEQKQETSANPSLDGSGAAATAPAADAIERMSNAELEAMLRKNGMLK